MAKGLNLKVLMQLQAKEFQKGLKSIQKQLGTFKNYIKGAFALGSVTAFGKQMVDVSKDFEQAMAKVKAVTNASTSDFAMMTKEAKRLGETTKYTATEAAEALENLTRNGLKAADATKALSTVLSLSQANDIGLGEGANILTNTMNMFNLTVNQSQRISDVLSNTASNAATNISELYDALVNSAPAANVLGFSLEEVSAAIGALANKGVKGAEAGTQLRMALTKLGDPKIQKKLEAFGITINSNTMKTEGLLKTVQKLKDANLGMEELVEIFSQKGAVGIQQFVSAFDDFGIMLQHTTNAIGTTARMAEQGVGSVQKELSVLKSSYEGLLISIGEKTSGVVKSTVKLLQNLIANFKTVGGTIMNIASVAVPLLVKNFNTLSKTVKAFFVSFKAEAATVSAAIGNWIGLIATLVTWVGTALVGAWSKNTQAMRDAKKEMKSAETEAASLKAQANALIEKLGDGTDPTTLAGVVNKLCQLFPDFADAIRRAAAEAAKTGDWDKLKQTLQDIANLQVLVLKQDANQKVIDAATEQLGKEIQNKANAKSPNIYKQYEEYFAVRSGIEKGLKNTSFDKDTFFQELARLIVQNAQNNNLSMDEYADIIKEYLDTAARGWDKIAVEQARRGSYKDSTMTDEELLNTLIKKFTSESLRQTKAGRTALNALLKSSTTSMDIAESKRNQAENIFKSQKEDLVKSGFKGEQLKQKEREYAQSLYDTLGNILLDIPEQSNLAKEIQNRINELQKAYDLPIKKAIEELTTPDLPEGITGNKSDKLADIIEKIIEKSIEDVNANIEKDSDELSEKLNKSIEDYLDKFNDILERGMTNYETVYSTPRRRKRDTSLDYKKSQSEIDSEELSSLNSYAEELKRTISELANGKQTKYVIEKLSELERELASAQVEANNLNEALQLSEVQEDITKLKDDLKTLAVNGVKSLASDIESVYEGFKNMRSTFEDGSGVEKFFAVFNQIVQIVETIMSVYQTLQTVQKTMTSLKTAELAEQTMLNGLKSTQLAEDLAILATLKQEARVAAGINAMQVPFPGNIPALAANEAALLAAGAFAKGGYVNYGSPTGDKTLARVNKGELIANGAQQHNLLRYLNGTAPTSSSQVEFKIRGSELVGVINNYNKQRKG